MISNSETLAISTRFNSDLHLPSATLTFFQKGVFYLGSRILIIYHITLRIYSDQDSSVVITTRYGLDGPGIESRWWRDFPHPSRPALGTTQPPGGKAEGTWRSPPTPI